MKKFWISTVAFGLFLSGLFLAGGCGTSSSSSGTTYSYGGPGSAFAATLNADGTFTITKASSPGATVDVTISGTYVRNASGFLTLTVTSVVGSGGPSVGDTAYGIEVPGFALILKPMDTANDHVIPMVVAGTCPTANFSMNWIAGDSDDSASAASNTQDFFGTFSYTASSNSATLPAKYALQGLASLGSGTVGTLSTCSNGIITFTGGAMWLTSLGGALVHANQSSATNDQIIIGMPQTAISSTAALAGNYAGLLFDDNASSTNRTKPVAISLTASSATLLSGTGSQVSDVTTGATSGSGATLSLNAINSPSTGFATGTITIGSNSGVLACAVAENAVGSGKTMIYCVGQSPDNNTKPFNVLMVTK